MSTEPYDPYTPKGYPSPAQPAPGQPSPGQSSSGPSALQEVQTGLNEARQIAMNNFESIVKRGEKVDNLQDKAAGLSRQAEEFKGTSRKVRRREQWRHNKWRIYLALGIIALLAIIIIPAVVVTRK